MDHMYNFTPKPENDRYCEELRPRTLEERKVTPWGMGFIWFGLGVMITCFMTIPNLVPYYSVWELIVTFALGITALILICTVIGDIGIKTGTPFGTTINASFGPKGGQLVGIIRIAPGLAWFGLNAWYGGGALNEITKILFGFDHRMIFIWAYGALACWICIKGVKTIEKFAKVVTPLMVAVIVFLFVEVLKKYGINFADTLTMGGTEGHKPWIYNICVTIGGYTAIAIGFNDFTKDFKMSEKTIGSNWLKRNGKFCGVSVLLGVLGYTMCCTLATVCVVASDGADALSLITELASAKSIVLAVCFQAFIFVAQVSTITSATLYPAVSVIVGLAPKKIKPAYACCAFAAASLLLQPWNIANLADFMMLLSATGGSILGVIVVDYYIFRKGRYSMEALLTTRSKYYYSKGFNVAAMITYVVATIPAVFSTDYGFLISIGVGMVLYYFLAKAMGRRYPAMVQESGTTEV